MNNKEIKIRFNEIERIFLLKIRNASEMGVCEVPIDTKLSDNYSEEIFQHTDIKDIFYDGCDLLDLIEPLEEGSVKATICHPEDDMYPHKLFTVDVAVNAF